MPWRSHRRWAEQFPRLNSDHVTIFCRKPRAFYGKIVLCSDPKTRSGGAEKPFYRSEGRAPGPRLIAGDEDEGSSPRGEANRLVPGKSEDRRMPSRGRHAPSLQQQGESDHAGDNAARATGRSKRRRVAANPFWQTRTLPRRAGVCGSDDLFLEVPHVWHCWLHWAAQRDPDCA